MRPVRSCMRQRRPAACPVRGRPMHARAECIKIEGIWRPLRLAIATVTPLHQLDAPWLLLRRPAAVRMHTIQPGTAVRLRLVRLLRGRPGRKWRRLEAAYTTAALTAFLPAPERAATSSTASLSTSCFLPSV
jgi:hypothetical protein